jgi:hypothetical protein
MRVGTPVQSTGPEPRLSFRTFLEAAGKLAVARQVSGLVFVVAVLTLPGLTTRATSTDFVWAYFAMLTLTSLLGLGLERLAGTVTAERGEQPLASALGPVLAARAMTSPLAAASLWVLFAFVGVHVAGVAWGATFVWIVAGLFGPLVFAALRVVGNSSAEPIIMVSVRAVQAAGLITLAVAGAGLSTMLVPIAALEVLGVVIALRMVGSWRQYRAGLVAVVSLPVRRGAALAGIEVVGLFNLRADLLLIGRILGATSTGWSTALAVWSGARGSGCTRRVRTATTAARTVRASVPGRCSSCRASVWASAFWSSSWPGRWPASSSRSTRGSAPCASW